VFYVRLDDGTMKAVEASGVCNNECLMNPIYHKLAQIAYDTVLQTMIEGEKEHGDEWKSKSIAYHKEHALRHAELNYTGDTSENHTNNGMTRNAMIKYLEAEHAGA
jgi:hypothetical protein